MIAERVGEDKRAVASEKPSVVRFRRVLERWRITSLLIAWISWFMVLVMLSAVGASPKLPAGLADDHISQSGEVATLPVRRCEGPTFDEGPDDDSSAKVSHGDPSWGVLVGGREPSAAPLVAERHSVARLGPSSPSGPPLHV